VIGGPLGAPLLRNRPDAVARMILTGSVHRDAWTPEDLHLFADVIAEPARARASSLLYRSFLLEDLPGVVAGRYRETQLPVPTTLLYGTKDLVVRPWMLQAAPGWSMEVVTADDSGHFLPEERPDLVASAVRQEF
jgi:pimeloyl-ACP methyl ester carboxylesterase